MAGGRDAGSSDEEATPDRTPQRSDDEGTPRRGGSDGEGGKSVNRRASYEFEEDGELLVYLFLYCSSFSHF